MGMRMVMVMGMGMEMRKRTGSFERSQGRHLFLQGVQTSGFTNHGWGA